MTEYDPEQNKMVAENLTQIGAVGAAYAAGYSTAWGVLVKWLLPKELGIVQQQVQHLQGKIDDLTPEVEEYRALKKGALERELDERRKGRQEGD